MHILNTRKYHQIDLYIYQCEDRVNKITYRLVHLFCRSDLLPLSFHIIFHLSQFLRLSLDLFRQHADLQHEALSICFQSLNFTLRRFVYIAIGLWKRKKHCRLLKLNPCHSEYLSEYFYLLHSSPIFPF